MSLLDIITDVFRKRSNAVEVPLHEGEPEPNKVNKAQKFDSSISSKEKIILESIGRVGSPCTHNQVLKDIETNNLSKTFDLNSNWKETWKIMKDLVKRDVLTKDGRYYNIVEK